MNCLKEYRSTGIKDRKFPLKCPGCQNELTDGDIKEAVDEDDMEKYIEYSFTKYINENLSKMSWCPTIDCGYVFEMDPNQSKFDCPQCIFAYCLSCKCDWHNNMTCKDWKANTGLDTQLKELFIACNYKKCPNCKMWVEKISGCNHMGCSCGIEFCYACGGIFQRCACCGYKGGDNDLDLTDSITHLTTNKYNLRFDPNIITVDKLFEARRDQMPKIVYQEYSDKVKTNKKTKKK